MSFKISKDAILDSLISSDSLTINQQTVPRVSSLTTSSIYFDSQTDTFYGMGNNSASPLNTRIIGTANVGVTPAGMAISTDGTKLYVANNNNYSIINSVTVIDLTTFLPIKTILDSSFNAPYTITINNTNAYVTNSATTTITIIDTVTDTVTGTITGFDGPSGMVIKNNIAYVNNYGSGNPSASGTGYTVSVVNLNTNTITSTLTVGPSGSPYTAPASIAISPAQDYVYTINYVNGNAGTGTISIIRTSDNSVDEGAITGFSGPFAIVISPTGLIAYVTNFGSNNFIPFGTTISVVDLVNKVIIDTINLGIQPSGLAISNDGSKIYASNYNTLYQDSISFTGLTSGQGTVNIIDTNSNTVIQPTINVGLSPSFIVLNSANSIAYISNYASNTVTSITI